MLKYNARMTQIFIKPKNRFVLEINYENISSPLQTRLEFEENNEATLIKYLSIHHSFKTNDQKFDKNLLLSQLKKYEIFNNNSERMIVAYLDEYERLFNIEKFNIESIKVYFYNFEGNKFQIIYNFQDTNLLVYR